MLIFIGCVEYVGVWCDYMSPWTLNWVVKEWCYDEVVRYLTRDVCICLIIFEPIWWNAGKWYGKSPGMDELLRVRRIAEMVRKDENVWVWTSRIQNRNRNGYDREVRGLEVNGRLWLVTIMNSGIAVCTSDIESIEGKHVTEFGKNDKQYVSGVTQSGLVYTKLGMWN